MIHVIVSRQIKLITENSQRELIVNILIKKKKKICQESRVSGTIKRENVLRNRCTRITLIKDQNKNIDSISQKEISFTKFVISVSRIK